MTVNEAKNEIENFLGRYNNNISSFEGFIILSDFFEFITTEPKTKK